MLDCVNTRFGSFLRCAVTVSLEMVFYVIGFGSILQTFVYASLTTVHLFMQLFIHHKMHVWCDTMSFNICDKFNK